MKKESLEISVRRLMAYIEKQNYRGYDPYDALKSPLFKLPFFRSNKLVRFGAQQLLKRFPANLRPLLAVPKGYNPVTLGLCIQAYSNLQDFYPEMKDEYLKKTDFLIDELIKLIPKGFQGACWGYDFNWEARRANIPAYQPTIVATGIITNALFRHYLITENKKALDLCISATKFILRDLNKTYDRDGGFCFSYSPFDKQQVFNASMKGVRLMSQVYFITRDEHLQSEARKAVAFLLKYQRSDGSWPYSMDAKGGWVDNYHTGYVLECLYDYSTCCQDISVQENLDKGYEYYKKNFFEDGRIPKFYHNNTYPIDCTSAAQSIITLIKFENIKLAENVAEWIIENMQGKDGSFFFRKFRNYTVKTPYMRWSNAWMFAALTEHMQDEKIDE